MIEATPKRVKKLILKITVPSQSYNQARGEEATHACVQNNATSNFKLKCMLNLFIYTSLYNIARLHKLTRFD